MSTANIGWAFLAVGGLIQIATGMYESSAQLNNVTFDQTTFGQLVGPINKILPIPLGYSAMIVGGFLVLCDAM